MERYSRQIMLDGVGDKGQRRLAGASVLIVGLGGLGAPVASYLTGAGVGRIGLCDKDTVSLSNLQRQILYTEADLGQPKCECALRRLQAMSSQTAFDLHPDGLTPGNAADIISGYDLVVDCCDNFATRYLIDDVCRETGRRWIFGSIGEFNGYVGVFGGRSGAKFTDLFADRETLSARPAAAAGVLGPVPGVVGAIEASEALKTIVGIGETLDGRLFCINLLTLESNIINI